MRLTHRWAVNCIGINIRNKYVALNGKYAKDQGDKD